MEIVEKLFLTSAMICSLSALFISFRREHYTNVTDCEKALSALIFLSSGAAAVICAFIEIWT